MLYCKLIKDIPISRKGINFWRWFNTTKPLRSFIIWMRFNLKISTVYNGLHASVDDINTSIFQFEVCGSILWSHKPHPFLACIFFNAALFLAPVFLRGLGETANHWKPTKPTFGFGSSTSTRVRSTRRSWAGFGWIFKLRPEASIKKSSPGKNTSIKNHLQKIKMYQIKLRQFLIDWNGPLSFVSPEKRGLKKNYPGTSALTFRLLFFASSLQSTSNRSTSWVEVDGYTKVWRFRSRANTPWKFNSSPLKIYHPKRRVVFQPSFFRGELFNFGRVTWIFLH